MNALDQFLEQRNNAMFIQCLGENISIKCNNKTLNGFFLGVEPNKLNSVLYQENSILLPKKEVKLNGDFEYFQIKNISLCTKKVNSKCYNV